MGFDAVAGVERPRSIAAHLENQVVLLELELATLQGYEPSATNEKVYGAIDALTDGLSMTIDNAGAYDDKHCDNDEPSLASSIFLSQSPVPALGDYSEPSIPKSLAQSTTISLVPRHVINLMLKNYCSIYLAQYPALEEADLYESCNRIFSDNSPSHYDTFTVAITLTISVSCDQYS